VHGLAHITGGGLTNLPRLNEGVGWAISSPLPVPPVFALIQRHGDVPDEEMWEVFNMGCGFVAVVPAERADDAVALLGAHHPGTAIVGRVTDEPGRIRRPA
jgi:phosphoribosylformylglycinamidine cyclo-ligase